LGANRVQDDIAARLEHVRLALDELAPETVPEKMPLKAVADVREARKLAVELTHPGREAAVLDPDDEVVVVRHQAVGETVPPEPSNDSLEELQEDLALVVVDVDSAPSVAARTDVVRPAGNFDPRRASH